MAYDICDPKRLRTVYQTMKAFGRHIQLSVFECELTQARYVEMCAALETIIHHTEDQVLIVDLGPPEGRAATRITAIGRPYERPERHGFIL